MTKQMQADDPALAVPPFIREQIGKYTDSHLTRALEFFAEWCDRGAPVPVTLFLAALKDERAIRTAELAHEIEPEVWH